MTRGRLAMLAGAATTLLLSAWVAAAGPVAIFARKNANPLTQRRAPGTDFEAWSNVAPPPKKIYTSSDASESVVAVIVWGLKLAIVAIIATVVFMLARELWRRERPGRVRDAAASGGIDTLPETLLEGAGARLGELQSGTPSNAIVACWLRLEAEVTAAGLRHDPSRTSSEVVATVLRDYDVDAAALRELALLFREARFSVHDLDESHRARARDALTAIHVDLRRAAAKEALRA